MFGKRGDERRVRWRLSDTASWRLIPWRSCMVLSRLSESKSSTFKANSQILDLLPFFQARDDLRNKVSN
jgi:hypothetical protein